MPHIDVNRSFRYWCAVAMAPIRVLVLCVACCVSVPTSAQTLARPFLPSLRYFLGTRITAAQTATVKALKRAMANGASEEVRKLASQLELDKRSRELLNAEMQYNLPVLLKVATSCSDDAIKEGLIAAARQCNAIAYHAAFSMGDARAMFQRIAFMQAAMLSSFSPIRRLPPATVPGWITHLNGRQLARTTPSFQVHLAPGHDVILVSANHPRPLVRVSLDGHDLTALVDTGSPVALVMSASTARTVGVDVVASGLNTLRSPAHVRPPSSDVQLGVIASFRFGPLTFRNLAVRIVPDHYYTAAGVTVGLPVLAQFHRITFSWGRMVVNARLTSCANPVPATRAVSSRGGVTSPLFDVKIARASAKGMFDTGSDTLLIAKRRFMPELTLPFRVGLAGAAGRVGPLAISVGGGQIASPSAVFLPIRVSDVVIGAPLLESADVQLTFSPLSFCIVPHAPQEKR